MAILSRPRKTFWQGDVHDQLASIGRIGDCAIGLGESVILGPDFEFLFQNDIGGRKGRLQVLAFLEIQFVAEIIRGASS